MKRKVLVTILCLAISVSMVACGKENTTEQQEVIATEQTAETEIIEEPIEQETETALEQENKVNETDEIAENIVYDDVDPEKVDPKTTKMDAETAAALGQAEKNEIEAKYGSMDAFGQYAVSQGADVTSGWCWIYYTGQGAGDQESYAVYMKEDSPRYGEVFHLGDYLPCGSFFVGANNEEHGIADVRLGQRQVENGELNGVTFDEDGTVHIVID